MSFSDIKAALSLRKDLVVSLTQIVLFDFYFSELKEKKVQYVVRISRGNRKPLDKET